MWFPGKQRHSSHQGELGQLSTRRSNVTARLSPGTAGQFNTNKQHLLHRFPKCHVVFLQKKKGKSSQEDETSAVFRAWIVLEVSQAGWLSDPTAPDTSPGCAWVWIPVVSILLIWARAHLYSTRSDIIHFQVPCSPPFFLSVNILLTLSCKCLSLLAALSIPN